MLKTERDIDTSFWQFSKEQTLMHLSASEDGLSNQDAAKRIKEYGPNKIKANSNDSAILLFLSQFKSPVTILLIAAALLSGCGPKSGDALRF